MNIEIVEVIITLIQLIKYIDLVEILKKKMIHVDQQQVYKVLNV